MTPHQFLARIARQAPPGVCLFLGAEAYQRARCRQALIDNVLPGQDRDTGFTRYDLDETALAAVVDDACALSLFSPRRLIWVTSLEASVPRTTARGEEKFGDPGVELLRDYVKRPSPGVVLVLEAARFELEGEGKKKLERVQEFFSFIPDQVEFPPFSSEEAHRLAVELAQRAGLALTPAEIALLVESTGSEAARIASEIEKLSLYAGPGGRISTDDIERLVPNARAATIFNLVSALGRGDRRLALAALDVLVRENEYLPLALSILGTQFRQALVAQEAGLRSPQQIQSYFSKLGVPMWPSRAREISETVAAFSRERLDRALEKVHQADKSLRDARPDDRIVVEEFVFALTARN